jgi:2-polyprenyl-6-methoxyphenol hydroxylase-like FAD-dependent oxidoreductase
MRTIAIVGAGQSGLQLALSLLAADYPVTLLTNRDAKNLRGGRVISSQCMFHDALETEREKHLNFWEADAPCIEGISLTLADPQQAEQPILNWRGGLDQYAQSVDQRLKMAGWMEEFERLGGKLIIAEAGVSELERLSASHDLVLLAAGKGDIVSQFSVNTERSRFDRPQRALALTYIHGMRPMESADQINFNLIPGVGEYFTFPAYTLSGVCDIMVFEGIPGGPMDCWENVSTARQHLQNSRNILQRWLPWEADRCSDIELTDAQGFMAGRFTPCVREPVLTLPSGRRVLGMADALVLNDPITGQGSNSAAKCAHLYLQQILARGDAAFDENWMVQTFEHYWDYARHVVNWTNSMLLPPSPHVMELMFNAADSEELAGQIVNGFNQPAHFDPWWFQQK